jgi:hypothetical protein
MSLDNRYYGSRTSQENSVRTCWSNMCIVLYSEFWLINWYQILLPSVVRTVPFLDCTIKYIETINLIESDCMTRDRDKLPNLSKTPNCLIS